jgi:hypothetical protein
MSPPSRPTSQGFFLNSQPTLHEILSDTAPSPYSLASFMAFLSQNHCLETLEFIIDAERYSSAYAEIMSGQRECAGDPNEYLCSLWRKLMDAYLNQSAPHELNVPGPVQKRLLELPCDTVPPHPSELDEAVRIVHELINYSVLGPFLASVATTPEEELDADEAQSGQHSRRKYLEPVPSRHEHTAWSPKTTFMPLFAGLHRHDAGHQPSPGSSFVNAADLGIMDAPSRTASPAAEPITPPTTPPTADWGFGTSPNTLQRAINAHNSGWKKMGEKLGIRPKSSRSKRGHNKSVTSAGSATEAPQSSKPHRSSYPG